MGDEQPPTQRDFHYLSNSMQNLARTLDQLRTEMASTYVRKDVIEPQLADIRKDVDAHSDWMTWAQRLIIGAVVLGLLGLLIYVGGKPA